MMSNKCTEYATHYCKSYPNCYGCNAYKNPTNFDRIKNKIPQMSLDEFIHFCGGDSCENIICGEIPHKYCHCKGGKTHDCGTCIKEYLEREVSYD